MSPRRVPPEILDHYSEVDERERLKTGTSRLELERTREILMREIPDRPVTILDIGGGAGTHACWLARLGHRVHLLDPVPKHVEQAARASAARASAAQPGHLLAGIVAGDARCLPYDDACADIVLLLGPLYHLTERSDRLAALREAHRVLVPGGRLYAAAISRFASLLDGLFRGFIEDPSFAPIVERDLADGQHRNPTGNPCYFTTAFFHRPEDLAAEIRDAGLSHEKTLGIEGPFWLLQNFDDHWDRPRRRRLIEAARRLEAEPSMLGSSAHWLALARRLPERGAAGHRDGAEPTGR